MSASMTLAPPRKAFSVDSLLEGRIDVLSLLHYLHEKQATAIRDLLVNMLYDLQPEEIDSILPQLVHLWVQWEEQQAAALGDFFLVECARSQLFTLKIMWMLQAEEAHAPTGSRQLPRISEMLKQAEMAHVNAEILTGGGKNGRPVGGRTVLTRQGAGSMPLKRSATQDLRAALRNSMSPNANGAVSPPARSQSNAPTPRARMQPGANQFQRSPGQGQQQQSQQQRVSPGANRSGGSPGHAQYPLLATLPSPLVQLVNVSIVPADIGAPIDAVVSVHIRPTTMRINNPALAAPSQSTRSGASPRSPALQGRPGSAQRRSPMPDGPAAAFTQSMSASPPAPRWTSNHQQAHAFSSSPPAMSLAHSQNMPARRISQEGIDPLQRMAQAQPAQHYSYPQQQQQQPARRPAASIPIGRTFSPSIAQMHSPSHSTSPFSSSPAVARAATAEGASSTPQRSESPPALDVNWPAADQDIPPSSSAPSHSAVSMVAMGRGGRGAPGNKYATMGPPRRAGAGRDLLSPGASSPSASRDGNGNGMDEPTLFHLLSKQVRSEYFNLELLLFNTLHDLSMVLAKVPVHDRNRVLREQLHSIDDNIIRGLYFPLLPHSSVNHEHYRILRLLPDDCWTLASRDKAPFLLHLEIAYAQPGGDRGAVSIYDSDTYTIFKSNEEIMLEAMLMAGITQQAATTVVGSATAPAANSTPGHPATPVTPSTGEATAAALVTAAQIAHLKDAPPGHTPTPTLSGSTASPKGREPDSAANVQANGLNIVSDSSTADDPSTEAVPGAHSIPALDSEGKPLTRSRSSTEVRDLEGSDTASAGAPASTEGNGSASSAAQSAHATASQLSAPPNRPDQQSSSSGSRTKSPLPQSTHAASYPVLPSEQPKTPQPQRTVPQANPFRPRRATTYQTGPTLCDTNLETLDKAFGESFLAKKRRVYASSPFASQYAAPTWDVISVIFKGGDDLRQEVLAMQFITAFDRIFRQARLPLWLKTYAVVCTSADSGLIETIPDAVSIDSLKKRIGYQNWTCLADFFAAYFGAAELAHIIDGPDEYAKKYPFGLVTYQAALRNFVESIAAYSILSFLLQVKDRHNGNIMIDRAGHIIHIDWGFMLSNSPGGNWNWEQAPFKLTSEYIDVMGGVNSDLFSYYRMLVTRGFLEARAHVDEFVVLCAVHQHTSHMPCFSGPTGATAIDAMRERFAMHLQSESEVEKFVDQLIDTSIDNWRTRKYDRFQKLVSGIL